MRRWAPFLVALIAQFLTGWVIFIAQWISRNIWAHMLEGETPPRLAQMVMGYGLAVPILGILGTIAATWLQRTRPEASLSTLALVLAGTLILLCLVFMVLVSPLLIVNWKLS